MVISEFALGFLTNFLYDSSKKIPGHIFNTYSKVYNKAIKEFSNKKYKLTEIQIETFFLQENVEKTIEKYLKNPDKLDCSNILINEFFELFSEEDFSREDADLILNSFFEILDAEIEKEPELRDYLILYLAKKTDKTTQETNQGVQELSQGFKEIFHEVQEMKSLIKIQSPQEAKDNKIINTVEYMKENINNELINILKKSRVLFIGDKVSKKSGIESFGNFIIETIELITKDKFSSSEYCELRKNLHSESAFKILLDEIGDNVLIYFEHFNKYNPNKIHYYIANEIKNGKYVFTTNMDSLIERACEDICTSLECKIVDDDCKFMKLFDKIQSNQPISSGYLFKLNGYIDEGKEGTDKFEKILSSLDKSDNGLNVYKKEVLKHFLKKFNSCFLGFDCLDNFSLVPVLKNIKTDKFMFWFNYAEEPKITSTKELLEAEIEKETSKRSRDMRTLCVNNILLNRRNFSKISGKWIEVIENTLYPIQDMNQYAYSAPNKEVQEFENASNLCENVDDYKKNIIFGRLWEECLSRDRSIWCFEKAAKIGKGVDKAKAKQKIAQVYDAQYGKSEAKAVIKEYKISIKLYNASNIFDQAIQCKLALANYKRRALDQFNEALNDCKEVEKIIYSEEFKNWIQSQKKDKEYNQIQAQYYNCLGLIYSRLGPEYLNKCESLLRSSLDYREKVKDIRGEAESENALGLIKRNNHTENIEELNDAIHHLCRSLAINESIGNYIGAARNYRNLGLCYTDLINLNSNEKTMNEYIQQAKKSYENGINYWYMMKEDPPVEDILEFKYRLGKLEICHGDNSKGIKPLREVETGWRKVGNWDKRVRALHLLCIAYNNNEFIYSNGTEYAKRTVDEIIDIYNAVLNSGEKLDQMKNNVKLYENAIQILKDTRKIRDDIGIKEREIKESDNKIAILDEIIGKLKGIMDMESAILSEET